jgi:hypothetical protein
MAKLPFFGCKNKNPANKPGFSVLVSNLRYVDPCSWFLVQSLFRIIRSNTHYLFSTFFLNHRIYIKSFEQLLHPFNVLPGQASIHKPVVV